MIRSIVFRKKGVARLSGRLEPIVANTILLAADEIKCFGQNYSALYLLEEEMVALQAQYWDLISSLGDSGGLLEPYRLFQVRCMDKRCQQLFKNFFALGQAGTFLNPELLSFLLLLCDWDYFLKWSKHFLTPDDTAQKRAFCLQILSVYAVKAWSTQRYAQITNGSARLLTQWVKEYGGSCTKNWFNQEQLLRTTRLLARTDLPVAQVALLCGFRNHAYFSSKFRQNFHCTPRYWRTLHRSILHDPVVDHLLEEVAHGHESHPKPNAENL